MTAPHAGGCSTRRRCLALAGLGALGAAAIGRRQPARALSMTREIADMTWVEVRDAIQAGSDTVIVPSGGLEQNGPHMVIGKHDRIVAWAARRIAAELGDALVAPVVSYVPWRCVHAPVPFGLRSRKDSFGNGASRLRSPMDHPFAAQPCVRVAGRHATLVIGAGCTRTKWRSSMQPYAQVQPAITTLYEYGT